MAQVVGLWAAGAGRDLEGHRIYFADWLVQVDGATEGPQAALFASGIPLAGSVYALPSPCTDYDPWAFCTPERGLKVHPDMGEGQGESDWYIVTSNYTTKPMKRCNSSSIEDPLNEPPRISGGYNKVSRERLFDKNGAPLLYTTFERIRGPVVERRDGLPTIQIQVNLPSLPLGVIVPSYECVNNGTWWGYSARKIRLMDFTWERKLYGTCSYYFTVTYSFEFNSRGYDQVILNEGMKKLKSGGVVTKPGDYEVMLDKDSNPIGPLPIKADGSIAANESEFYYLPKQIDWEYNFGLLPGLPVSL